MGSLQILPSRSYFGQCPQCKHNDGFVNIGRAHWFFCKKHRVKWYGGHDIFPGWRNEHAGIWKQNEELMSFFLEIEPYAPGRFPSDEELLLRARSNGRPEALRNRVYCSQTE